MPTAEVGTVHPLALLIGQRIANWRKQRGWSQEELAKHMDVGRSAIAQIEGGRHYPSYPNLDRLSVIFGVHMGDILDVGESGKRPFLQPAVVGTLMDLRHRDNGRFLEDLEALVALMRKLPQPAS